MARFLRAVLTIDPRTSNMKMHRDLLIPLAVIIAACSMCVFRNSDSGAGMAERSGPEVRLAYFPNLTHAPGIIGVASGAWQKELRDSRLSITIVNAGPEAMEAMLAGELDFSFVGPSPAINTYLKSHGRALQVISGACLGGASLVSRQGANINSLKDLNGKRVAVPQTGGTQDVSCRYFMKKAGLSAKDQGGTVEIVSVKNSDILSLLKQGELDAAWVPEPWASRLRTETGARTILDERDLWPDHRFSTTLLVVRRAFSKEHPEIVDQVLRAHLETLNWMKTHDRRSRELVNRELKRMTGKALKIDVLDEAWSHLSFNADPDEASVETFAKAAADAGYLKDTNLALEGMFASRPVARRAGGR